MSGEWSSNIWTMSVREGLFAPAFCAFSVRILIRTVSASATALGGCSTPSGRSAPGMVGGGSWRGESGVGVVPL